MVQYGSRFPQYLSSQLHILWWEIDEVAIILMLFVSAMMFGGAPLWIALFTVPWLYCKAKKNSPKGYFKHLLYYAGLTKLDGYPSYFMKRFRE